MTTTLVLRALVLARFSAIAVFDLGVTLAHLASHRLGLLWRFQSVHHRVRRLYGLNGLMKHPIHQLIETTAGIAPLLVIGIPEAVAASLAACAALQLLLQHSNVDYRATSQRPHRNPRRRSCGPRRSAGFAGSESFTPSSGSMPF